MCWGGKGALVQKDKSATLATNNDQYLFQPVAYGISSYESNSMKSANPHSGIYEAQTSRTLDLNGGSPACNQGGIAVVSVLDDQGGQQINVVKDGKSPTLRAQMHGHPPIVSMGFKHRAGSGAGSVGAAEEQAPTLVSTMEPAVCIYDARGNGDGEVVPTITGDHENRVTDYTAICIQGNGIDRADTAGCNGRGWCNGVCYTLNTIDRHAVCFAQEKIGEYKESEQCGALRASGADCGGGSESLVAFSQQRIGEYVENCHASTLMARDFKSAKDIVCSIDCRNLRETPECSGTLQAKGNGGYSLNYQNPVRIRYIVRRLTPTECARLQGFPDRWGDIKPYDGDYDFWLRVRQTFDSINGRAKKQYTEKQIEAWYNKLHTDSAEYKMWGNGIALPNALYVMEGIVDSLQVGGELP